MPKRVACSNIVFEQEHYFWRRLRQNPLDGLHNASNTSLDAGSSVTACVKDDHRGTEQRAALQCPAQQSNRFFPDKLVRRGKVDEIGGMNDDREKVTFASRLRKSNTTSRVTMRRIPARRVAGKDLNSVATEVASDLCGLRGPCIERHMTTESHHVVLSIDADVV